jgi:hypothetical protein
MLLSCVLLVVSGVILMTIGSHVDHTMGWSWLRPLPWNEFGGILVGAGLLSVWLDHFFEREKDEIDELRLRRLLHEQAPAMRDAVLEAFAANEVDLARVATPQTLDQIITNSLALRLHDPQFASEIYTDIRDQAVGASERWHDATLSIKLSPAYAPPSMPTNKKPFGAPTHFLVTVRWEYTTIPAHVERRFVCVSDRQEYVELANERGDTSAWYIKPAGGIDVSSREAFELLHFAVNGEPRPIRRATRRTGQIYTTSIGQQLLEAKEPVTITYTYSTLTTQAGHLLFFDIEQPTRNLRVDLDYSDCGIESVSALDLMPSVRPTRIERSPASLPEGVVRVDVDGWIFPRSGIAFVWTRQSEVADRGAVSRTVAKR